MQVAKELALDDRGELADHIQVAPVVSLREDQLVVLLGAQVTLIHARRHVSHNVDLKESRVNDFRRLNPAKGYTRVKAILSAAN